MSILACAYRKLTVEMVGEAAKRIVVQPKNAGILVIGIGNKSETQGNDSSIVAVTL